MDTIKLLQELQSERRLLDEAIITMERMERGSGPRRGRLRKLPQAANGTPLKRRTGQVGPKSRDKRQ